MSKPRILLTNDDGVRARGLRAAYEALREVADVTVVAPSTQKSGASHTITLEVPLRAVPLDELPGFRVDFTPVDCVKLALKELLPEPPDLVVSGINRGPNAGVLTHYSGTVAAAKEAALNDVPAVAVSLAQLREPRFEVAAEVTRAVALRALATPLPRGCVLNVNVPPGAREEVRGVRWCRLSERRLEDDYEARKDPRGRPYYWLSGAGGLEGCDPEDDFSLLRAGYVTVTPLTLDWTHPTLFPAGDPGWLPDANEF
ncbi:MAG: 5'/3'-nucleotidase SurE [Planctomycetota bacterium]|nr:MAG: 5'/3'-nucleotidase SurE [Planctomycetota bacterium]